MGGTAVTPVAGAGSAAAVRRARISSGTAATITTAETPITVYSSHGVRRVVARAVVAAAQVDQGDGGRCTRPQHNQPYRRAHPQQDAVLQIKAEVAHLARLRASHSVNVVQHQQLVCVVLFCIDDSTCPSLVVIEQLSLLNRLDACTEPTWSWRSASRLATTGCRCCAACADDPTHRRR